MACGEWMGEIIAELGGIIVLTNQVCSKIVFFEKGTPKWCKRALRAFNASSANATKFAGGVPQCGLIEPAGQRASWAFHSSTATTTKNNLVAFAKTR